MTDGWGISCKIALIWMSQNLTDKSTLVQVMAWYRQATSHYLSQCWPSSMSPYGVTRPAWLKSVSSAATDALFPCHHSVSGYAISLPCNTASNIVLVKLVSFTGAKEIIFWLMLKAFINKKDEGCPLHILTHLWLIYSCLFIYFLC